MRYSIQRLTIRRPSTSLVEGAAVACAFAIGVWLFPASANAQEIKKDSWRATEHSSTSAASGRSSGALGDFDGDQRADVALAEPWGVFNGAYRYRVDVHLSTYLNTTFDVDSGAAGGLHISARDVDGDRDLDLVITSQFGREPIGIWINDGHGAFSKGQADAYIGSVWQETDYSLQTPRRPDGTPAVVGFPTGTWTTKPARFAALLRSGDTPSRAPVDPPALNKLNLGSPFRAPPLL